MLYSVDDLSIIQVLIIYFAEDFTEELFDYYKTEIGKLKEFFDHHRAILTRINEWDEQFHKLVTLEVFCYICLPSIAASL